jgi:hypothetical protein
MFLATSAYACSCAPIPDGIKTMRDLAQWRVANAKLLFIGRVKQIDIIGPVGGVGGDLASASSASERLRVVFQPQEIFKGSFSSVLTVFTGSEAGSCGFPFETGKTYLVDVTREENGKLSTSICNRATMSLDLAGPELRVLHNQSPTASDMLTPENYWQKNVASSYGQICGRVVHSDNSELGKNCHGALWQKMESPVGAVDVGLVHVNPDGSFCTKQIQPGKYFIGFEDGEPWIDNFQYRGYYHSSVSSANAEAIDVKPHQLFRNATVSLFRQRVFLLTGRIAFQNREEAAIGELLAVLRPLGNDLFNVPEEEEVNSDGTFSFRNVAPGRYFLSIVQEPSESSNKLKSEILELKVPEQTSGLLVHMYR